MNDHTHTSPARDEHDPRVDDALRAAVPALGLPAAPSHADIASWKRGDGVGRVQHEPAEHPRPPLPSRPARRIVTRRRVFALSSAALVALAAGAAVFLASPRTQEVRAATILQSLRAATIKGLDVRINGVTFAGVCVTGDARIRFAQPLDLGAMMNENAADDAPPSVDQVHAALQIRMGDTGPLPGSAVNVELASSAAGSWLFAQSDSLGPRVAEVAPFLMLVQGPLQAGVVIDLGDDFREGFFVDGAMGADAGPDVLPQPATPEEAMAHVHRQVAERHGAAVDAHRSVSVAVGVGSNGRVRVATRAPGEPNVVTPDMGGQALPAGVDDAHVTGLARSVVSGQAGASQLQEIQNLINGASGEATVTNLGNGQYLLVSREQNAEAGTPELRLLYAEGQGIVHAEVSNLPDASGGFGATVRVVFAHEALAPELLDKSRVVVEGETYQFSLPAIEAMFGGQ